MTYLSEAKKNVGYAAANFIEDGMTVGLGTGSTAFYLVEALGKRIKDEGLNIKAVTTSTRTADQAKSLDIPLYDLDEVDRIDLTIDGADEVNADYDGLKGGGGALLYEKIVATYSDKIYWVVTEDKMVDKLGAFPLPVEVVPYGSDQLMGLFEENDLNPVLRQIDGKVFITDSENYIIDLHLKEINAPNKLGDWLIKQVGVVEHGLFLAMVNKVLIGTDENVSEHDVK